MTSRLHVYETSLKTTDATGKTLVIITPDCLTSRARSRSFGGGSCFFLGPPMKTCVYIGAFNLYCDCVKGHPSGDPQIISPVDRPSQLSNRQLIVNRFPVIVNSAALNPSRIHQSRAPIHQFASENSTLRNQIRNRPVKIAGENIRNYPQPAWPVSVTAGIYYRAGRPPAIRLLESSDNHPTKRRNHPTDFTNLPIIYRQIPRIYRSDQAVDCTRNGPNVQSAYPHQCIYGSISC
jgi:hypothetical protein